MAIEKIAVSDYISGRLRRGVHDGDLTDYNASNRAGTYGNWIYPDFPRITDLLKNRNNFPRISVTSTDSSQIKRMGMRSTLRHDLAQIVINIYSPPNLTCEILNVASEDHTYTTGTDTYDIDHTPVSIIGATIDGTKDAGVWSFDRGVDYELSDSNYTGRWDSVKWLGVDLPDDGTDFTIAYNRRATGNVLCRIIAKDVDDYIRENWQSWFDVDHLLTYYTVTSNRQVELDAYTNICRHEIYCTFKYITGDTI
jgi:hypothetical protein